jgi:hypothetical protein
LPSTIASLQLDDDITPVDSIFGLLANARTAAHLLQSNRKQTANKLQANQKELPETLASFSTEGHRCGVVAGPVSAWRDR